MEHEVINQTCPEMQELIEDLGEVLQRMQAVAQSHRPLFAGEVYLTGREVCQWLFLSPRTLQDYRDKGILSYTQIAGKILYKLSDINKVLEENYIQGRK